MYLNHIKKSKINYILYVFIWFLMCISRWEIIPISQCVKYIIPLLYVCAAMVSLFILYG